MTDDNSSDTDEDKNNDDDDVHTSKPFTKGKTYLHVKKKYVGHKQQGYYFLKATVQASYSQKKYPCTLTISENSGTVKEGTCTCSAAGLGRCAHVAALLFAIDDFILELGNDVPTCTEKLCGWNKGRRQNKNPTPVFAKKYSSMKRELRKVRVSGEDL